MTHREQQRRFVDQIMAEMQSRQDTGQIVVHVHRGEIKKVEPRPVYQVPRAGDVAGK